MANNGGQRTSNESRTDAEAEQNRLIREQLIGKLREPKCVDWLKYGGLISMSIDLNLKQRCGVRLTESEQETFETYRVHSRTLYWIVVLFAVRQFLLISISSSNVHHLLGDMTEFWPGERINYLFPSLLLSVHSVTIIDLFKTNERELYWYLPFLSLKLFWAKSDPLLIDHGNPAISDHSAFNRSLDTIHSFIFFTACFLGGMFGFVMIVTLSDNYSNYNLLVMLLWYMLELF